MRQWAAPGEKRTSQDSVVSKSNSSLNKIAWGQEARDGLQAPAAIRG